MELTPHVTRLGREFATLAEAGGDEARAVVERVTGSLEAAIRMTLLDVLSEAADEISCDLAPGSVELRLRGREPGFVVTAPSGPVNLPEPVEAVAQQAAAGDESTPDAALLLMEDGPAARINVRLPDRLKTAIEEAAVKEGRSVNAWLVRAAAAALQGAGREQPSETRVTGTRTKQRFTGWVR